jgi:hypothetical protein
MSSVMNPHALRQTVKRTFDGTLSTVLAELFQNAQRSGATRVDLEQGSEVVTVCDNGHGLPDLQTFHALVSLGDSHFENPDVEAFQHPMGVGFHSVLALEGVREVTITSCGFQLRLDPLRWWNDPHYYESWQDQLILVPNDGPGTTISMVGIATALETCLSRHDSPARGYAGILDITLDSETVDTSLPSEIAGKPLFTFASNGAAVSVFLKTGYAATHVARHFGQLVALPSARDERLYQYHPFHVLVDVTATSPFDFKAPVRDGVVENTRWQTFEKELEDVLFERLPTIDARLQVDYLRSLHRLNSDRAEALPYLVIAKPTLGPMFDSHSYQERSDHRVVHVDDAPLLLDQGVVLPDKAAYAPAGVESFLAALKRARLEPWVVERGQSPRTAAIHWSPGQPFHVDYPTVVRLGRAKLVLGDAVVDLQLSKEDKVFAVLESASMLDDAEFYIGGEEPVHALREVAAAAFCSESDDYDAEILSEWFERSVDEAVRTLLGDALPEDLSYRILLHFLNARGYTNPSHIHVIFKTATEVMIRFTDDKKRHRLDCVLV